MRTTLREALQAWRERRERGDHPTLDELYALASSGTADPSAPAVVHLTHCARCVGELQELADAVQAAAGWDIALAKAAAGPGAGAMTVTTACGKYVIALYPRPDPVDEAVITIEVSPAFRSALEGASVIVEDRNGRELLRGPIVLGRASGRVRGLRAVDYTRLTVRTVEALGT